MAKKDADTGLFNDSVVQLSSLLDKLQSIERINNKNIDIPVWTKKNADDYWTRIVDLEKESTSIKGRLIGVFFTIVIAIIGLIASIVIDYSKLSKYIEAKEQLEEQIRSYQAEFSKLQYQTNNIENYINIRVENEVNKALLELYKK